MSGQKMSRALTLATVASAGAVEDRAIELLLNDLDSPYVVPSANTDVEDPERWDGLG